jgi:predicted GNAT family acetyltransferase
MATEVQRNDERSRYELLIDGELVGIADYHERGNTVIVPHTEIERSRRGQGLGAVLVRHVLDDLRGSGRSVVPACWYVARFIDEHPEYQDLLAA